MQQDRYLPLVLARKSKDNTNLIDLFIKKGYLNKDFSLKDYLDHIFNESFIRFDGNHEFSDCDKFAISKLGPMVLKIQEKRKDLGYDPVLELQDYLGMGPTARLWSETKKVYKIDGAFFDELIATQDLKIYRDSFKHLPFPVLYIDLEDCGVDPILGAFLYTYEDAHGWQIVIYMNTRESAYSFYSNYNYENNGYIEFDEHSKPNTNFDVIDFNINSISISSNTNDRRIDIIKAIMQIVMFLASPDPDLKEITRKTYKPSSEIKDVYSEIQGWSVGVRFGKAIKAARREANKAAAEEEQIASGRKPPRPHIRAAHWQRYHVGKGRSDVRTNWVPPTFVVGRKEIPVVIHRVKE